ncbi:hypothetical protein [Leptolyngbya sp. FACHB-261]|uniref:hypothetical protein n=1 Tax=Leptolyngbya sp. FACHB-261 TaxID=2692806 RepID=UPI0016866564|nr:hypothetical protein [Leptolyngbya sp. FACHB-261]MBD2100973.1 hypothetical protein [Leptolyngbya sp. FACHB-261]
MIRTPFVDFQTQQLLLAMVGGSHSTAQRLLQAAQHKYLGQTEQWVFERVIADLERDRR